MIPTNGSYSEWRQTSFLSLRPMDNENQLSLVLLVVTSLHLQLVFCLLTCHIKIFKPPLISVLSSFIPLSCLETLGINHAFATFPMPAGCCWVLWWIFCCHLEVLLSLQMDLLMWEAYSTIYCNLWKNIRFLFCCVLFYFILFVCSLFGFRMVVVLFCLPNSYIVLCWMEDISIQENCPTFLTLKFSISLHLGISILLFIPVKTKELSSIEPSMCF